MLWLPNFFNNGILQWNKKCIYKISLYNMSQILKKKVSRTLVFAKTLGLIVELEMT